MSPPKTRFCFTSSSTVSSCEVHQLRRRCCLLAQQFLTLAEQQKATAPIMIGHRLLGNSLLVVGDFAEGLAHLDRALALYDPAAHRPLATRFGQDIGVRSLSWRPLALWMLGYPGTALAEAERPVKAARETGHATEFFDVKKGRHS